MCVWQQNGFRVDSVECHVTATHASLSSYFGMPLCGKSDRNGEGKTAISQTLSFSVKGHQNWQEFSLSPSLACFLLISICTLSLFSFHPSCALSLIWELTVKWMPGGFLLPPPLLYHRQRKNYSTVRVALLVHLLSVCTESVSVLLSGVSDCWLVPHMLADRKAGVWDGPWARPRNSSDNILNQSLQSCFSLSHRPPTSTSLSFPNPSPGFFSSSALSHHYCICILLSCGNVCSLQLSTLLPYSWLF